MKQILMLLLLAICFSSCKKETTNTNTTVTKYCNYQSMTSYDASGNIFSLATFYMTGNQLDSTVQLIYNTAGSITGRGVSYYTYVSSTERWQTSYNANGGVASKVKQVLDANGYIVQYYAYDTSGTVVQSHALYTYNCQ